MCFFSLRVQFISDDKKPINSQFNTTHSFRVIKISQQNPLKWTHFYCIKIWERVLAIDGFNLISPGRYIAQRLHTKWVRRFIERCHNFTSRKSFSLNLILLKPTWGETEFCGTGSPVPIEMCLTINRITCKSIYCRENERMLLQWQFTNFFRFDSFFNTHQWIHR